MESLAQFLPLILLIVLMYFLMIRPQKKKDKQIQEMRNSLCVGDEIVTIGGICGRIIKIKDESIIIQVGADKVKFEMMKWAVSTVTKESNKRSIREFDSITDEEETSVKKMPKRLRKSGDAENAEEAPKAEAEPQVEEAPAEEEA